MEICYSSAASGQLVLPGVGAGRDSWRPVVLSRGRLGEGRAPAGLEPFVKVVQE
jgi:hypothetical protein